MTPLCISQTVQKGLEIKSSFIGLKRLYAWLPIFSVWWSLIWHQTFGIQGPQPGEGHFQNHTIMQLHLDFAGLKRIFYCHACSWSPLCFHRFDEVCHYTFFKEGPQPGTNHFTQLVWKESTELGIGKASNKQSDGTTCTFIVARYKPQGNFENDDNAYTKNVNKGSLDPSYCNNVKKAGLDGGYGFKRFQRN